MQKELGKISKLTLPFGICFDLYDKVMMLTLLNGCDICDYDSVQQQNT